MLPQELRFLLRVFLQRLDDVRERGIQQLIVVQPGNVLPVENQRTLKFRPVQAQPVDQADAGDVGRVASLSPLPL